jgi:hypothetical protein
VELYFNAHMPSCHVNGLHLFIFRESVLGRSWAPRLKGAPNLSVDIYNSADFLNLFSIFIIGH